MNCSPRARIPKAPLRYGFSQGDRWFFEPIIVIMADAFHSLDSESAWTAALEHSDETPVLIYKHSATCPVSTSAQAEVEAVQSDASLPVYRVVVQEHRAVSNTIEDALGIRHETPQVILLHEQTPVFDTSHFDVTAEILYDELQRLPVSSE
jgi:bacillithiol system protein YtxJ